MHNSHAPHIQVTRIAQDGSEVSMILLRTNILEVSKKDDNFCWVKYWDGSQVRSIVAKGSLEHAMSVFC